ncbi:MAG: DUF3489 domain-containing protein [Rhodospirillaceae bacterium]
MTTLSDLTLAQLTAIYSAVSGKTVGVKFFNSKATGLRRVEALLAEGNVTLNDAFRAAEIEFEPEPARNIPEVEDDGTGCERELEEDGDIPGTEDPPEPGMVWNSLEQAWEHPAKASDAATILTSSLVINDTRDWLVRYLIDNAGLDPETAVLAALRAVTALKLPEPAARPEPATPRLPRSGTKQDQVIALLRRPQGTTLAEIGEATGWAPHTCRGVLAGALKKRLGLTITSTKDAGGQRTYHIAG